MRIRNPTCVALRVSRRVLHLVIQNFKTEHPGFIRSVPSIAVECDQGAHERSHVYVHPFLDFLDQRTFMVGAVAIVTGDGKLHGFVSQIPRE